MQIFISLVSQTVHLRCWRFFFRFREIYEIRKVKVKKLENPKKIIIIII